MSMAATSPGPALVCDARPPLRKLIVRDGRLAGAVVVGDPHCAPMLVQLFDRGDPVPQNPIDIFCSAEAFTRADGSSSKELCNCNRVSEETVLAAIDAGSDTVEMIRRTTRAGTGCGSCVGLLSELLDRRCAVMATA